VTVGVVDVGATTVVEMVDLALASAADDAARFDARPLPDELFPLGGSRSMGIDNYRALLPAPLRGESWLGVFVGAAFMAAADALVVTFLALAVFPVTETVEPVTRVFDEGLRDADFEGWGFLGAVAVLPALVRDESWLGVFVAAAFLAAGDAFGPGFLAWQFALSPRPSSRTPGSSMTG
jgi:hypothetical protein